MGINRFAAAVLGCGALAAHSAELPDCKLDSSFVGSRILERARPTADAGAFVNVSGNLRNGTALTFAKDDAVLVVDVAVTRTRLVVAPTVEINLKSSWALSYSYRLTAQTELPIQSEVKLDDGRKFLLIRSKDSQILFIDEQGRFCNKVLNARSSPAVWAMGTLSQEPDDAPLDMRVVEIAGPAGSLRIIFNGVGAGQMSFQEVWVNGPTVVSSQTRNFDQFAQRVKVGPFAFDVLEVGGGRVTLRYEIPERAPITTAESALWQLRARR